MITDGENAFFLYDRRIFQVKAKKKQNILSSSFLFFSPLSIFFFFNLT